MGFGTSYYIINKVFLCPLIDILIFVLLVLNVGICMTQPYHGMTNSSPVEDGCRKHSTELALDFVRFLAEHRCHYNL